MSVSSSPVVFGHPESKGSGVPADLYRSPRWYACRTRSRAEKQASRLFQERNIESYLPLHEQTRQWADRKKQVEFPLFPGYIFARFHLGGIHHVLEVPGIVTVVRIGTHPTPVCEAELDAVRILADGIRETGVLPSPADCLSEGDDVVVIDGAFKGMKGVLHEERGKSRVVVRLSVLRQAVSVALDRQLLRPAR